MDWPHYIIVAAANPDSAVMRRLLDRGADIMTLDARGRMPLHWAAGFNSLEMVGLLIDSGSEVPGLDEGGETPLHLAAATNPDPRVADLLLRNGAKLHGETQFGRTPLSMAVISNRQAAVVEWLLDQGADPEDGPGTLLHLAAFSGASDVVRLLLERGLDPNAKGDEGSGPPLLPAAMGGDPLVVKALCGVRCRRSPSGRLPGLDPLARRRVRYDRWLCQRDRDRGGPAAVGPRGGHPCPGQRRPDAPTSGGDV